MSIAFGSPSQSAYLTRKERLAQRILDPKSAVKGKHAPFESSINKTLGVSHILNDDEYRFMMMKGAY